MANRLRNERLEIKLTKIKRSLFSLIYVADKWLEYIKREKVTVWNSVPAIYEMLLTVAEVESDKLHARQRRDAE